MPAGQMIGPGPVLTARRARFAGRRLPMCAPSNVPGGQGVELPGQWPALFSVDNGLYVGPLRAAVLVARGGDTERGLGVDESYINSYRLITATGKFYNFQSAGAFNMWASIAAARLIREVELAESMSEEKRAAWLAVKRGKLEKIARGMVNAAAKVGDASIAAALIEESNFALSKWGHYA